MPLIILTSQSASLSVQPYAAAGGAQTASLKFNSTAVAAGSNSDGQLNVDSWMDILRMAAGGFHTVGVKSDGTVLAAGDDKS